ncbi:hypothetical protein [Deinococcus fonticola]|uniref:hypothetical protein n=1 Tax=Deinococcus fonticola TaxID=2528713 RepID=UPI0010755779|nr:hypothetical protein [Deinococcus fonticola]
MNLSDVQTAFQSAYRPDPRDGLTVTPQVNAGDFTVQVRYLDADGELRGFDVVAQPTPSEGRSAPEVGLNVAEVVARELAYGQLSAADEEGQFKRIVV